MAILFELSESMVKQAALISSKFPDRTLLSIIEECFNYGVKSLYTDVPKPVPPQRKPIQEYFNTPITEERLEDIQSTIDLVSDQAKQEVEEIVYYSDDESDSYGEPILNSDGLYEL